MNCSPVRLCAVILMFLVGLGTFGAAGLAQTAEPEPIVITLPADLDPAARDAFLRSLESLESPITVTTTAAASAASAVESEFATAISRLDDALYGIVRLPAVLAKWWASLGGGLASLLAVAAMLAALALGLLVEWGLDRLLASRRRRCLDARPERFSARLGYALAWFALEVLGVAAFGIGAFLGGWLMLPQVPDVLSTFGIILATVVKVRILLLLGHLLFAPHHRNMRLIPMPDDDALVVWRWLLIAILAPPVFNAAFTILVETEGITRAAGFLGLASAVVLLAARLTMFLGPRRQIRALILKAYASPEGDVPGAARLFAETWHIFMSAAAVFAFLAEVYALLSLDVDRAAIGGLLYLILLPFVLGAWTGLIRDLMIDGAAGTRRAVVGGILTSLGQGVILLLTFAGVARTLGADPLAQAGGLADRIAGALFEAGGAVLLGWALWSGIRILLDQYTSREDDEVSEEGMGKEGSRIETLVPVIRSFLFVTIIAIAGMTALSALGVQIGPLLTGAGVIGLAVGFGAQTLVSDVITGLFYLLEDAFRKGEYIECDAGKGVVEKISLRSLQLRHHRGPLYTIAFSNMGNVINHSRDWVKIKFLLRVPFDTDLEKVRKVIKKVGQDLLQHPDLGKLFLQPLKSQGVMDVDDSAFIIGVKFLCKPGEQFMIRREAYARIKQAFVQNGIEFASRRVTVETERGGEAGGAAAAAVSPPAQQSA